MKTVVNNRDSAQKIWLEFNKRNSAITQQKPIVNTSQPTITVTSKATSQSRKRLSLHEAVIRLQQKWRALRLENAKIAVRIGSLHQHTLFFVGKEHIKKSLNKEQLAKLKNALDTGDWSKINVKDANLPYLAFHLFQRKMINDQQFFSIVERIQVNHDHTIKQTYQILDANGEFTEGAKTYLIPYLSFKSDPITLNSFRWLVSTLLSSEQVFYTSEIGEYSSISNTPLAQALTGIGAIMVNQENNQLIHLSFGAKDAYGIANFGINNYVRPTPRLGKPTTSDIEIGVRQKLRVKSTEYPDAAEPYNKQKGIHDTRVTPYVAGAHDVAHGYAMSSIPENMVKALHKFIDIARNSISIPENAQHVKMTKEIWTWTDCTYEYFLYHPNERAVMDTADNTQFTKAFCNLLHYKNNDGADMSYLITNGKLTALGISIFYHMHNHKSEWLQLKIDPDQLIEPFKHQYELIGTMIKYKKYIPLLNKLDSELKIIALHCLSLIISINVVIDEPFYDTYANKKLLKVGEKFLQFFVDNHEQLTARIIKIDQSNLAASNARINMMHPQLLGHMVNPSFLNLIIYASQLPNFLSFINTKLRDPLYCRFENNIEAIVLASLLNLPLFALFDSDKSKLFDDLRTEKISDRDASAYFKTISEMILNTRLSFDEIKSFNTEKVIIVFFSYTTIKQLMTETELSLDEILNMPSNKRNFLLDNVQEISKLIEKKKITPQSLSHISLEELQSMVKNLIDKQIIYVIKNPSEKDIFFNEQKDQKYFKR